jgi:outer membrane protein OmpA-like peptidoglycan-associated protein
MKKLLTLIAVVGCSFALYSQEFLGYANSNYAGVNGIDLNPASIADSRYKVDILLTGTNLMFQNNYIGFSKKALDNRQGPLLPPDSTTSWPAFDDSLFQDKYIIENLDGQKKSVFFSNKVWLPSVMFSVNEKISIGLTGSLRSYLNVDGVEEDLAHQLYNDFGDSAQYFNSLSNERLSIQYMSWWESGITYSQVIMDNNEHFLKAGVRPKMLFGLGSAYIFVENLKYMTNDNDTLTFISSEVQYGHSTNFDFPSSGGVNYNLNGISSSPGVGLDFGLIYEWRPDHQKYRYDMDGETNLWMRYKNKYKLRVGFAVNDIGSVKFDRGQLSGNFNADIDEWYFRGIDLGAYPVRGIDSTIQALFQPIPTKGTYRMNLPTTMNLTADYNIWKDFYVNFTGVYAVQWKKNPEKVHELSMVSLTPRWDWKWFGAWMPMSYNQYRNFQVGAGVRLGPVIIGTNNLATWFSHSKTVYGADIHVALKVPIMYRPVKDRDKDKVSDKKDKCKEVPGVWEFMGCPDRDGDHVQDSEDICPDEPGLKQFNGCPDRDNDQIIDKQDACPDEPGLQEFNGCPDKDGDKIIDKEDDCPDEAGLKEFKGCPDKDGDGVMDKIDICPEKPGPVENEGCPEVILNLVDLAGQSLKSAKQAKDASFTYESLPSDSLCVFRLDGDPDKTAGVNEVKVIVNGLPKRALRSQSDGLFRFDIPKPAGNGLKKEEVKDVIPVLTKEEQEILKKAFDNLEFESGKDIIKQESFASLDELAELLKKKPEWKLRITGHTDNVGKPAANMKLSEKRAKAVKAYLVKKGIDEKRLITEWYGQTRPIAPNNTPEGRQKNRRVEMLIIEDAK